MNAVDNDDMSRLNMLVALLFVYQGAFLAIFIYLLVTGYNSNLGSVYFTPTSEVSSSQKCKTVQVKNSASYLVDTNGYWEGSNLFSYDLGIYQISFQSVNMSLSDYSSIISSFESDIELLGNKMSYRTLGFNLMAWGTFSRHYDINNGTVVIKTMGNIQEIFNIEYYGYGFTSASDLCFPSSTETSANAVLSYDYSTSTAGLKFTVDTSYAGNARTTVEPCEPLFNVEDDFFYDNGQSNSATISIDMKSVAIAYSINTGMKTISTLSQISVINDANSTQFYGLYIDIAYPGMTPILCYQMNSDLLDTSGYSTTGTKSTEQTYFSNYPETCVVRSGNQYFYPIINHLGLKTDSCWEYLDKCVTYDSSDFGSNCNDYSVTIGLLYFPSVYGGLTALVDTTNTLQNIIANDYDNGDQTVSDMAYDVMAATIGTYNQYMHYGSNIKTTDFSSIYGADTCPSTALSALATAFPKLTNNTGASMYVLGLAQPRPDFLFKRKTTLNAFSAYISDGAYSDTLYSSTVFSSISDNPPTKLIEVSLFILHYLFILIYF